MKIMEARVVKHQAEGTVHYTVYWSALQVADKYRIINSVPSESGIFELYYRDHTKQLQLFHLQRAWYGGLRNALRKMTDPELNADPRRRKVLEEYPCFFRYFVVRSFKDMSAIYFTFARKLLPRRAGAGSPGRRAEQAQISIEEISPDKIVTI
jgi:hypothetical protein